MYRNVSEYNDTLFDLPYFHVSNSAYFLCFLFEISQIIGPKKYDLLFFLQMINEPKSIPIKQTKRNSV